MQVDYFQKFLTMSMYRNSISIAYREKDILSINVTVKLKLIFFFFLPSFCQGKARLERVGG